MLPTPTQPPRAGGGEVAAVTSMDAITLESRTMSKHTPGPWRIEQQNPNQCYTAIGKPIAVVGGEVTGETVEFVIGLCCDYGPHGVEQTTANAHLVASAPDLLEACELAGDYLNRLAAFYGNLPDGLGDDGAEACMIRDMIRAALRKVEGGGA